MTMDVAQPILMRFVLAFVLAVALVPLCRFVAAKTGVVAHPRNDRWHRHTIPLLGGVAIAVSTLVVGWPRECRKTCGCSAPPLS